MTYLELISAYIKSSSMFAIFLCIGIGYLVGKIKVGKFQLGGIAGSLLVAVFIGQLGYDIPGLVKTIFFGLFVYACGYKGGPSFFGALNKKSLKFVVSAVIMTVTGLICVYIAAIVFNLDRGLAAGLASGGLTQSAILGTAGGAIDKLGLSPEITKQLNTNVAVGYSVTYIFGSLGPILMTGTIIPLIMKWDLRKAATDLALIQNKGGIVLKENEIIAEQRTNSRTFEISSDSLYIGKGIREMEMNSKERLFLLDVARDNKILLLKNLDGFRFKSKDRVVIGGRVNSLVDIEDKLGKEIFDEKGILKTKETTEKIIITNPELEGKTIEELKNKTYEKSVRGFVVTSIVRNQNNIDVHPDVILKVGDELTLVGRKNDIENVIKKSGYLSPDKNIVNYVTLSLGMLSGILIGHLTFPVFGIPVSLGTGGGCLLAGLIFGWLRSKHPKIGGVDSGTLDFLQNFGLVVFISIVGLNAGQGAIIAIKENGLTLLWLGVFVTLVPQIFTFLVNYFILDIKNPIEAVSIIAGGRSSNPAFSEVLSKAGNSTPVLPFTIGYAVANILLTMWGPIIIALITNNG